MKKIKTLLIPLTATIAATPIVLPLTSCNKEEQDHRTKYNVSVNESNRFTYDEKLVGENKAIKNEVYSIKFTCVDNFQINKSDVTIKINNKIITDFGCAGGYVSIPSYLVKGDISINITPTVINLFEIDSQTHQLKGFISGPTNEEIVHTCKGKLVIPASVTSIADDAFYDELTDSSTIPDSIKELLFEETIWQPYKQNDLYGERENKLVGYSGLKSQGEIAGIGKRAFKKSPFTHIKLPIGNGYTIDSLAFEDSKVQVLEMPNPDYIQHKPIYAPNDKICDPANKHWDWYIYGATETFRNYRGCYTAGDYLYLNTIQQEQGINMWEWMKLHQATINDKAFYNTKDLVYINFTPFTKYDTNAIRCFKLKNPIEGGEDLPSNATVLDFTYFNWIRFCDWEEQKRFADFAADSKRFRDDSGIKLDLFNPLSAQFNLNQQTPTKESYVYILTTDELEQQGQTADQIALNNTIVAFFNLQPMSSTAFGLIPNSSAILVRSLNNIMSFSKSTRYPADLRNLKTDSIEISLSSQEKPYLEINIDQPEGLISVDDYQIKTYGLKGDLECQFIAEPQEDIGIPPRETEVYTPPFNIRQVKKSELPEGEQAAYCNNKLVITWDEGKEPEPGYYEIWFRVKSIHMNRVSQPMHLYVTITE